jgi:predicted ATPase
MSSEILFPIIEGFWVKNYKVLKQISFGSSFHQAMVMDFGVDLSPYDLTPITTFIGPSGVGKSTILDVFSFISDCLNYGLDEAFGKRGGFNDVYHHGGEGPISFGVVFRACSEPAPITYAVTIGKKQGSHHAFVEAEAIVYRNRQHGEATKTILLFQNGEKITRYLTPYNGVRLTDLERVKQMDVNHLALSALGDFDDIPDIPQLKRQLTQFHYANYRPDNASGLTPTRYKPVKGGSLVTEIKRLKEKYSFEFPKVLDVVAKRLPGIESISYEMTESGRIVLSFLPIGQTQPFYAHQMSEGTLRLFSHLLQFEDPIPASLVGIEEPAAYMDEKQMKTFSKTARSFVNEMGGTQYFITTNQIALVDQLDPTGVWILSPDTDNNIKITRALDELSFQGLDLNAVGPYWYTDYIYRKSM